MKTKFLILMIIGFGGVVSYGVLENPIDLTVQEFQWIQSVGSFSGGFTCACLDPDGSGEYSADFCDTTFEITPEEAEQLGIEPIADPESLGLEGNILCTENVSGDIYGGRLDKYSEGCDAKYWLSQINEGQWPSGYLPNYKFNDIFQTTLSNPDDGDNVLVKIYKQFALDAISYLPGSSDDKKINKEIKKAHEEMNEAQKDLNAGKPDKAVDHYKKALNHAILPIKFNEKLALDTIAIAQGFSGDKKIDGEIKKAYEEMDNAKKIKNKGDLALAETHYGKASEHAYNAIHIGIDKMKKKFSVFTLEDALKNNHGTQSSAGVLAREAVASLLNAAHDDINYHYKVSEIISMTQDSLVTKDHKDTTKTFRTYNNMGEKLMCP